MTVKYIARAEYAHVNESIESNAMSVITITNTGRIGFMLKQR